MNKHLNIFRFFSESDAQIFIENNLSRALAICLKNDPLFFSEMVRSIVSQEDYNYLFALIDVDTIHQIDIQVDVDTIEKENIKSVYAVAITTDMALVLDKFLEHKVLNKKSTTDIFICIKDVAIVIEVKKITEDCGEQLFNQVAPFIKHKIEVSPKCISWQAIIMILRKVNNIHHLRGTSVFIGDFLAFLEQKYLGWFDSIPFKLIQFSKARHSVNYEQLSKRMNAALGYVSKISPQGYDQLHYNDRMGISLPLTWATELVPEFQTIKGENYVCFYFWPANTKQQGFSVYNKPLNWLQKNSIKVGEEEYEIEIAYHIKFSHYMGKFIAGFNYYEHDVIKMLQTPANFYSKSGKWDREQWRELEDLFDEYFRKDFDWKSRCGWLNNFENSNRNYLFLSFGFEICIFIPYRKFCELDKSTEDYKSISALILEISKSISTLI